MYDDLVRKILSKPALREGLDEMLANRRGCLDLCRAEWEGELETCPAYARHLARDVRFSKGSAADKNFQLQNAVGMPNALNVVVAGYWSFDTSEDASRRNSIVCRYSEPLVRIGRAMAEHDRQHLSDNCRFFVDSCVPLACSSCQSYFSLYYPDCRSRARPAVLASPDGDRNWWCVKNTKFFDGEDVRHASKRDLLEIFGPSTFSGVLNLRIYSRIAFGDNRYKIGGNCSNMILFKESALDPPIDVRKMYRPLSMEAEPPPAIRPPTQPLITFAEDERGGGEGRRCLKEE